MIAQTSWFNRRKYTGWGLTPKTWQGFLYVGIIVIVEILIQSLPLGDGLKMGLTIVWVALISIDVLHVMASIKMDEREQKIEAITERNASWAMVSALVIVLLYVTTIGSNLKGTELMPVLIFPLIAGVTVKGLSNYILDKRGI
jgi:hypothetical protein